MGKFTEALEAYDQVLSVHRRDMFAQNGRAEVLKAMGKFAEALTAYDEIRRDHPDDIFAQSGRAEVLKAMGRFTEALEVYDQIRHDNPDDIIAQNGRAEVLKVMGRFTESLAAYEQVRRDHPENLFAQNGRAGVLKAMGHLESAAVEYRAIRERHPENPVARCALANVLAELGRSEEALELVADSPRITAHDWIAEHIHGMIELRRANLDGAVQILKRGAEDCPFGRPRAFFRTALAAAEIRLNDYAAAEAAINAVQEEGAILDAVESIRTYVFGLRDKFTRAAESYRRLSDPTTTLAKELFGELERRYVDRAPAAHSDDWLFDRQLSFQMHCLAMAA
jgi:tetratricopeptide (TPR) repeat protein